MIDGVRGCEIVRLFIQMHQFWFEPRNKISNRRIVMQMIVAVESKRRDNQIIAIRMLSFEWNDSAFIAPEWGNDDGQIEIRFLGECFKLGLILADDTRL